MANSLKAGCHGKKRPDILGYGMYLKSWMLGPRCQKVIDQREIGLRNLLMFNKRLFEVMLNLWQGSKGIAHRNRLLTVTNS